MTPVRWPDLIGWTWDSALTVAGYAKSSAEWALDQIEQITRYRFGEVATGGLWHLVPLPDLKAAFNLAGNYLGLNVHIADGAEGTVSYAAIDESGLQAAGWLPKIGWLHELLHALGLVDKPSLTGAQSLFGYQDPHPTGLTADVIEFVQDGGANTSPDADVITVTGTAGGRAIRGGHGADTVSGSADADDLIYGNQGADHLLGNAGSDTLYGGQDADTLSGGAGSDCLYGNLGNDVLVGGDGLDTLFGGQGSDTLIGGEGDRLVGGLGADTFVTDDPETITDFRPEEGDVVVPRLGLVGVQIDDNGNPIPYDDGVIG